MKVISTILLGLSLVGCAYNSTTVNNYGDGKITVESIVDKPLTMDTLRGLGTGAKVSGLPL